MNAPLIWIVFPGVAALVLITLRHWPRLSTLAGVIIALLLALLAWQLPIGNYVRIWRWTFKVNEAWVVLGRQFVLDDTARPALSVINVVLAFWFGGTQVARAGRGAVPLGLLIVALMTAALAVEPFLYAALLIEMAALVSIPLLSPPGRKVGRGALRYLTFQTLGIPFLLFAGWIIARVEGAPTDQGLITRAAITLGLGFATLLAVFPFHTWVPMLAEDAHPYAAAFTFLMLPEIVALFGLSFLDQYGWLRSIPLVYTGLRFVGVLMVATGGLWAAFQRHLGRMLGYAVMVEIGFSLLTAGTPGGLPLHFSLLLPRALSLGVWALALSAVQARTGSLDFRLVQGAARRMPVAVAGIMAAHFTLAGLPLFAGFPVRLALWEALAGQYPWAALWTLLGSVGLMAGGLSSLAVLLRSSDNQTWQITETQMEVSLLLVGILALIIIGLFPQWFFPAFTNLPGSFTRLVP